MNDIELNAIKILTDNLIQKRQMIMSLFALLVSGTIGLMFLHNTLLKFILLTIGFYYIFVLILNYSSNEEKLIKLLQKLERIKND